MKIGTVTYWNTQDNYGQILQCYALLTTLRDMGHDAFLIKYLPAPRQQSLVHLLITAVRYLSPSYRRTALMWRRLRRIAATEALLHPRGFDQFRTEYIPSTSRTYNENELEETPPEADAYICGSDQIWGVPNPVYFLQFGKATTKRLAYAPSMGGITPKGKDKKTISTYLSRFDFISSREGKDVQTLHEMGFSQAIQQPDPTLLLSSGHYRQLSSSPKAANPYIFLYLLGNETAVKAKDIFDFAEKQGLAVRYVASQGQHDDLPKEYPTIAEWLGMVNDAAYVITNSFHGTIFCLHFNTPFMVLPVNKNIERMNHRIYDLLGKYKLLHRIYDGSLQRLFESVDFNTFNKKKKQEEHEAKQNLARILTP